MSSLFPLDDDDDDASSDISIDAVASLLLRCSTIDRESVPPRNGDGNVIIASPTDSTGQQDNMDNQTDNYPSSAASSSQTPNQQPLYNDELDDDDDEAIDDDDTSMPEDAAEEPVQAAPEQRTASAEPADQASIDDSFFLIPRSVEIAVGRDPSIRLNVGANADFTCVPPDELPAQLQYLCELTHAQDRWVRALSDAHGAFRIYEEAKEKLKALIASHDDRVRQLV